MGTRFYIWTDDYEQGCAVIKPPRGVEKGYRLTEGHPLTDDWPEGANCLLDADYPDDTALTHSLYGGGVRVISSALKAFIEQHQQKGLEYLPVAITDEGGAIVSPDYWVLNPIGVLDCIDLEASGVEWSPLDGSLIDSCDELVIDADRVPKDRLVFRPKHLSSLIIVPEAFKNALETGSFSGLSFLLAEDYIGI